MRTSDSHHRGATLWTVALLLFAQPALVRGQVLFEDDFESGEIDEAKWRVDRRPFETGDGEYEAMVVDGQLVIEGEGTRNWWGGFALATVPTFTASVDDPLVLEVDRVLHERRDNTATGAGENSSTRTSLWITDASRENYVFFSHNSNEGGWTYNKRVGDPDDNATNTGISIAEFDGLDGDFGEHTMGMVADGENVLLLLDGIEGPLVRFPFSEGIVIEIGVYARRGQGAQPTDMVRGVFDNVIVTGATEQCVALTPPFTQTLEGETPELTLQIPPEAPRPTTVTITSSDPGVAAIAGSADGVATIEFAAGDPAFRTLELAIGGPGFVELTLGGDLEACADEPIDVFVASVLVEADFDDGAIPWSEDDEPFEDGEADFAAEAVDGAVRLVADGFASFWGGGALISDETFHPSLEQPVTFQVDQTLTSASVGGFRAGVWVLDCERSDWIFFSFLRGGNGDWVVNSSTDEDWPPLGEGTDLAAYNCCTFDALDVARRVELVANGETVSVIMDGVKGGEASFEVDTVRFGIGVYALGEFDRADATFDNLRVLGGDGGLGEGCFPVATELTPGDANADGAFNIADAIAQLNFLFGDGGLPDCYVVAGAEPVEYRPEGLSVLDFNGDGNMNIADAIGALNHLFGDGAAHILGEECFRAGGACPPSCNG